MKKTYTVLIVLLGMLIVAGCKPQEGMVRVQPVKADGVQALLDAGAFVLEVRNPEELQTDPVAMEGALNIPYDDLATRLVELDYQATYIVVCDNGNTSGKAANFMVRNGIGKVYHLKGGMKAFRKLYPAASAQ